MLIGIRSSALKGVGVSEGKLGHFSNHGFNGVELSFNYEPQEFDWQTFRNAKLVRQQGETLGLRFTAHGPDHLNLAHPHRNRVDSDVEQLHRILYGISQYGAETVTFHVEGPGTHQPLTKELHQHQTQNLINALRSAERTCKKNNVRLLIETMTPGPRLTSDYGNILRIVRALQSPWIGICLDTNHLNLSEELYDAILKGGSDIQQFHCSDNHGKNEEHRMLGDGIINWKRVAKAAAEIHFDGNIILETNTYDTEQYSCLLEAASKAAHDFADAIKSHSQNSAKEIPPCV